MPDFPAKPLSVKARRAVARVTSREYRLLREESAADGVRRAARGRVEDAVERLRAGSWSDVTAAVHDTRKDLKKVRSVLRLARGGLPPKRYRRENARYRDAARLLASTRDAEVKLKTLSALREHYGDEVPPVEGLELLLGAENRRLGSANGAGLAERMEKAADAIDRGGRKIDRWNLEGRGWKMLEPGLVESYRRGRGGLGEVVANPTTEAVHEWRKGVKDLWYHLRLLRDTWPEALKGPTDEAHELSDLLGDHHDLAVLAEAVYAQEREGRRLLELVERRQRELLDAALPIGRRLYAEKPKQYAKRLHVYWKVWRKQSR
jgi:CHAD domain-containing protein